MSVHELKTWPGPFQAVWEKRKPYEVRKADRDFMVGDHLLLMEWLPDEKRFTGREVFARVTYMTAGGEWGLPAGLCVLGIRVEERRGHRLAVPHG